MPTQRNKLAPQISPIEANPVGWSSIYAPEVLTNPSPEFSALASSAYMTPEQKLGLFWNLATRRAKPYTNADLPALAAAGNEAYDAAAGFVGMTTPIKAYHGSPHTFDRFDLSKIGTGEGAQAYGHGLYFAGNEGVAKGYRDALQFKAKPDIGLANNIPGATVLRNGVQEVFAKTADPAERAALLKAWLDETADMARTNKYAPPNMLDEVNAARKLWSDGTAQLDFGKNPGSMYEVSLRTTPERLLDWNKPLSQQPAAVREAVQSLPYADAPWVASSNSPMLALEDARSAWMQKQGMDTRGNQMHRMNISRDLANSGLDGIQYLDAGSRAAGEGSRNYVMFRDDIIDILKRYGLLGMIGGGAAATVGNRLAPQGEQ